MGEGETRNISTIASTAKDGEPKHPHKAVLNAFAHRGTTVSATRGEGVRYNYNSPDREGWSALDAEPYHHEYDEQTQG